MLLPERQTVAGAGGEIQDSEEETSLWEVKEGFLKEEAWLLRAGWPNKSG